MSALVPEVATPFALALSTNSSFFSFIRDDSVSEDSSAPLRPDDVHDTAPKSEHMLKLLRAMLEKFADKFPEFGLDLIPPLGGACNTLALAVSLLVTFLAAPKQLRFVSSSMDLNQSVDLLVLMCCKCLVKTQSAALTTAIPG